MVNRPQEQHGVDGGVAEVKLTRVANHGADLRGVGVSPELVDVHRHQVAVFDPVTSAGQPQRVTPRPAADVGDDRRRIREVTQHDLLGPLEFEYAVRFGQPVAFLVELVIRVQSWVDGAVHKPPRCHSGASDVRSTSVRSRPGARPSWSRGRT
jgi:hypothetical protein